jgi:hypothetical protein
MRKTPIKRLPVMIRANRQNYKAEMLSSRNQLSAGERKIKGLILLSGNKID